MHLHFCFSSNFLVTLLHRIRGYRINVFIIVKMPHIQHRPILIQWHNITSFCLWDVYLCWTGPSVRCQQSQQEPICVGCDSPWFVSQFHKKKKKKEKQKRQTKWQTIWKISEFSKKQCQDGKQPSGKFQKMLRVKCEAEVALCVCCFCHYTFVPVHLKGLLMFYLFISYYICTYVIFTCTS